MCCTTGTSKHMGESMCLCVHASYADACWIPDVFSAPQGQVRGILLIHPSVSTSYVQQRPGPPRPTASPSPLLPSPDLIYLIDFHPAGHLYNNPYVCVSACWCVFACACACCHPCDMYKLILVLLSHFVLYCSTFKMSSELQH